MDTAWTTSQVIIIGVAAGAGGVVAGIGFTLHWAATKFFGRRTAARPDVRSDADLQWPPVDGGNGRRDGGV